ncbi:MAG: 30S ribosomal protein S12 methylthiotransferase RimO [Desulfitobacteriia bacterium]
MKKKAAVINLGCPKNQVDSEIITGMLSSHFEITPDPTQANLIIVNTCGFIEDAKEESIEMIYEMAELKKSGLCEKVYATGCLAQRYGQQLLEEIPELDGVLGDGDLDKITTAISNAAGAQRLYTNKKVQDFIYSHEMPRLRLGSSFFAYVKIAEGCDNCCSYCAIPQIKGRYRSRPIESIVAETERLAEEGVKEIILVAQDTTRYGIDTYGFLALPELLKELVHIEGIQWLRLMYCYPDVFSDELIEIMAQEEKICKYVDLPLQHADNEILAKMNRRNTAEEAENLIWKLRQAIPGIFIRSTFITGFPGETEEQFQKLLDFIKKTKLDRIGVFAYSQEENTPAAKMKNQVPVNIREERKDTVMALQADLALNIQQQRIGQTIRVILEEELQPGNWLGRTEGDAPEVDGQIYVQVDKNYVPGDIIKARILRADSYDLEGEGL